MRHPTQVNSLKGKTKGLIKKGHATGIERCNTNIPYFLQ